MKIVYSKTREQFPLSRKKILKKTIVSTLNVAILLVVFWLILFTQVGLTAGLTWVTFLMSGVLLGAFGINYLYQTGYFAVYFYELTDDFVQIRKGLITPREITIPYERIQDVYVDQDLFDRIFGLYDVHLSSATIFSGMEAHIDGVEKSVAEGLRDVLLRTIQQKTSKKQ